MIKRLQEVSLALGQGSTNLTLTSKKWSELLTFLLLCTNHIPRISVHMLGTNLGCTSHATQYLWLTPTPTAPLWGHDQLLPLRHGDQRDQRVHVLVSIQASLLANRFPRINSCLLEVRVFDVYII